MNETGVESISCTFTPALMCTTQLGSCCELCSYQMTFVNLTTRIANSPLESFRTVRDRAFQFPRVARYL